MTKVDKEKIQCMLKEISMMRHGRIPTYDIDDEAAKFFSDYVQELTDAVVCSSLRIAKHRGSSVVENTDIGMVFGKKFGMDIPGCPRVKPLHYTLLKNTFIPTEIGQSSLKDTLNTLHYSSNKTSSIAARAIETSRNTINGTAIKAVKATKKRVAKVKVPKLNKGQKANAKLNSNNNNYADPSGTNSADIDSGNQ